LALTGAASEFKNGDALSGLPEGSIPQRHDR
jgi:hypothetical protein